MPLFGPLGVQFFCPITRGVIGQKDWFPLGTFLGQSGSFFGSCRCASAYFLCVAAVKEPRLVHTPPGRMPGYVADSSTLAHVVLVPHVASAPRIFWSIQVAVLATILYAACVGLPC